jgi:hypothetical protein
VKKIVNVVCSFPTPRPTNVPTAKPTVITPDPTRNPTAKPIAPTRKPTRVPTAKPSVNSADPTRNPTAKPISPTPKPTRVPTAKPSVNTPDPTRNPTAKPSTEDDTLESPIYTCPIECSENPCPCEENPYCTEETCKHSNGCDQCQDGYWKLGYGFPCESCSLSIPNCNKCSDFIGCNECETGYERILAEDCIGDNGAIYYCDQVICEPYIYLKDTGTGQWQKIDGTNTFDYSGKYEYTEIDGNIVWLREDHSYLMTIEQLDDLKYYLVIGDTYDSSDESKIYYYLDVTMWNEYENPSETHDSSNSEEWYCMEDYSGTCYVSVGNFEILDCYGGTWTFCDSQNGDLSNFPDFIDCTGGDATLIGGNYAGTIGICNNNVWFVVILAILITFGIII